MDYPKITREGSYRLHIPQLSGGLNRVDPLDTVKDNQLTDCENVWFKDGVLQSRPAVHWTAEDGSPEKPGGQNQTWLVPPDGGKLVFHQKVGTLFYLVYLVKGQTGGKDTLYVFYMRMGKEEYQEKGVVVGHSNSFSPCSAGAFQNIVLFESEPIKGDGLYALVYAGSGASAGTTVWEHNTNKGDAKWTQITDDDVYAPLVFINGKGNKYDSLPTSGATPYPSAATFEGFNTLFCKFRAGFMADGKSYAFQLPCKIKAKTPLHIEYTGAPDESKGESMDSSWDIPAGQDYSEGDTKYHLRVTIDRATGRLGFYRSADTPGDVNTQPLQMVGGMPNNIMVTAYADMPACTLGNSTAAVWFGGSAKGINGGSRLFLAGDSKNPGKVCWSDQGRPLYFPENCYAYVGESGSPVTAMAKQDDMLVFFKENETYYTTYVDGPDYTADDILSGAIVDVTAVDAVFPIYQISPNIGCDQPNTIQNCDNRLIWASSPGHVYTLVSASIYSNANIYRLTDETGPLIDAHGDALAGTLDGWYYLFQGRAAYVMDYRTSAVRSITSYAKDRSPVGWYSWQLPASGPTVVGALSIESDGMLLISPQNGNDVGYITTGLFEEGTEDIEDYRGGSEGGPSKQVITSHLRTKLFDFGYPERMKKIASLVLKAGGQGSVDISFATERGQTPCVRHKDFYADAGPRDPGYLHSVKFAPVAPRVQQFGLSIQAAGRFALGGVSLYYKPMR